MCHWGMHECHWRWHVCHCGSLVCPGDHMCAICMVIDCKVYSGHQAWKTNSFNVHSSVRDIISKEVSIYITTWGGPIHNIGWFLCSCNIGKFVEPEICDHCLLLVGQGWYFWQHISSGFLLICSWNCTNFFYLVANGCWEEEGSEERQHEEEKHEAQEAGEPEEQVGTAARRQRPRGQGLVNDG